MYLSTIFKRKLLLAAMLLCAGMLSMTAATEADLKPIKSTYVYAFDAYTQNGAGTRTSGTLFGNDFFLDVTGGSVSTGKGSIDISNPNYVAVNGADVDYLAAKYTTYGSHLNSLQIKNAQCVIALKPLAGSVIYIYLVMEITKWVLRLVFPASLPRPIWILL